MHYKKGSAFQQLNNNTELTIDDFKRDVAFSSVALLLISFPGCHWLSLQIIVIQGTLNAQAGFLNAKAFMCVCVFFFYTFIYFFNPAQTITGILYKLYGLQTRCFSFYFMVLFIIIIGVQVFTSLRFITVTLVHMGKISCMYLHCSSLQCNFLQFLT